MSTAPSLTRELVAGTDYQPCEHGGRQALVSVDTLLPTPCELCSPKSATASYSGRFGSLDAQAARSEYGSRVEELRAWYRHAIPGYLWHAKKGLLYHVLGHVRRQLQWRLRVRLHGSKRSSYRPLEELHPDAGLWLTVSMVRRYQDRGHEIDESGAMLIDRENEGEFVSIQPDRALAITYPSRAHQPDPCVPQPQSAEPEPATGECEAVNASPDKPLSSPGQAPVASVNPAAPLLDERERALALLRLANIDPAVLQRLEPVPPDPEPEEPTLEDYVLGSLRRLREGRIQAPSSAVRNWASNAGHECERYLVYRRTRGEDAAPHDVGLQAVFDKGRLDESWIKRELEEAGVQVLETEMRLYDETTQTSGRIDFAVRVGDVYTVAELKSMNPNTWGSIRTMDDLENAGSFWLRKYPVQLAVCREMYAMRHPERTVEAALLLENKSSGQLKLLRLSRDAAVHYFNEAEERLCRVNVHVDDGTLPDRVDPEAGWCDRCEFSGICEPDEPLRDPLMVTTDARLRERLDRRAELEAAHREFVSIDKLIKARLKKSDAFKSLVAGRTIIKRSEASNGSVRFTFKTTEGAGNGDKQSNHGG